MATAWKFSARQLELLRGTLGRGDTDVACVAVSGSLNRMEGHSKSDLDLLIVIDDRESDFSNEARERIYDSVWTQLKSVAKLQSLKPPKPGGVFSACASWKAMTAPTSRGVVDANLITFGQRMQLLLDAQPVAGDAMFRSLQADLLHWYTESRVSRMFAESSEFHWLWQDVQRYWRSIRSRACWLHADEPRKSLEVNLKLRSSRLVLIAAFLQAICIAEQNSPDHAAQISYLQDQLAVAPLQRLAAALPTETDRQQLLNSYQVIWTHVAELPDDACAPPTEVLKAIANLQHCVNQVPQRAENWMF